MSEWISIADAKPKTHQQVDLWVSGDESLISFYCAPYRTATAGRLTDMRYTGKGMFEHIGGLTKMLTTYLNVTHWMPLPEPPK